MLHTSRSTDRLTRRVTTELADSEEFDTGDLSDEGRPENHDIKRLRSKAKERDALADENAKLKRDLALTKAGLDTLDEERVSALLNGQEGEVDVEALKAKAAKWGWLQGSTSDEGEQQAQVDGDLAAIDRMSDAMGGTPTGGVDPETELRKKIAEAKTSQELDAILAQAGRLRQT